MAYFYEKNDAALLQELADATILDEPKATGGDWPQWRGPHRDGVASTRNTLLDWPADGPERLWKITIGEGYSSFAVHGGRAYTMLREGDKEAVVCLDIEDKGKELWRFDYPCTYANAYGNGPRSTPTLDVSIQKRPPLPISPGDRLYTVGADGKFHCLDAVTGKPIWKEAHDLLAEFSAPNLTWGVAFSPLIEGDLVITVPGGPNASVVAFDKYTGEKKWATPTSDVAGYASPVAVTVAGRRQIIVFGGKALLGISATDGALLWNFPWSVNSDVNAATPTVFQAMKDDSLLTYVFISSGYDKGCALLKLVDDDGKPGVRPVYTSMKMRNHFASSVRHGDYLYGFDETKLACLDLKTGKKVWERSGFNKGSLLLAGDRLIVLGENGWMAVFAATPEPEFTDDPDTKQRVVKPLAEFRAAKGRCWTMPVIADGRMLVRGDTGKEIVCYDLRRHE
jgi:outer membrane protein assembly factor BamB